MAPPARACRGSPGPPAPAGSALVRAALATLPKRGAGRPSKAARAARTAALAAALAAAGLAPAEATAAAAAAAGGRRRKPRKPQGEPRARAAALAGSRANTLERRSAKTPERRAGGGGGGGGSAGDGGDSGSELPSDRGSTSSSSSAAKPLSQQLRAATPSPAAPPNKRRGASGGKPAAAAGKKLKREPLAEAERESGVAQSGSGSDDAVVHTKRGRPSAKEPPSRTADTASTAGAAGTATGDRESASSSDASTPRDRPGKTRAKAGKGKSGAGKGPPARRHTRSAMSLRAKAPRRDSWLSKPAHAFSPSSTGVNAPAAPFAQRGSRRGGSGRSGGGGGSAGSHGDKLEDEEEQEQGARACGPLATPESAVGCAAAARRSALHKKAFGAVRAQLTRLRFHRTFLDAYERDGWRSANAEKMVPREELARARAKVRASKRRLHSILQELCEGPDAQAETRLALDEDGGVVADKVVCAVCTGREPGAQQQQQQGEPGDADADNRSDTSNDVVLCDLEGCNRAFHQRCCDPPVDRAEIDDSEDWFCRRCMTLMECLNEINDQCDTDFDAWQDVFPERDLAREEAAEAAAKAAAGAKRTRKGRFVNKPAVVVRGTWDMQSFGSDDDDGSFGDGAEGGAEDGSSGSSSSEDEDAEDGSSGSSCSEEEEPAEILSYKRAHKKVDYQALAKQMFGSAEEQSDDAEFKGDDLLDLSASLQDLVGGGGGGARKRDD
jgi:hypothetical protein